MSYPEVRIETERLNLRLPRIEEFERYAELMADAVACRQTGGQLPRGAAWRKFLQMPGAWAIQGFARFSVIETSSGRWLRQMGAWQPDGWPGTEIGYAFHPDAWGHGHARESAVAAIDWAFDTLGWEDIVHCIALHRPGQPAVAEARAAARFDVARPGAVAAAFASRSRRTLEADARAVAGGEGGAQVISRARLQMWMDLRRSRCRADARAATALRA